jgi:hypothetical protein
LKSYRIASNDFCNDFRVAFKKLRKCWPNVSTDFGCVTLMEGWFDINEKTFAREVFRLMNKFEDLAAIIDDLLKRRLKTAPSPRQRQLSATARSPGTKASM